MQKSILTTILLIGLSASLSLAQTSKPVQTAAVEQTDIAQEWVFAGTVQARAEIHIAPEVPGRIVKVTVDQGDSVERGDVLVVLDQTKLKLAVRQAEAALAAAKAGHDQTAQTAEALVMVQINQAEAGVMAAASAVSQVKDLAYVQTVSQKEQAEAGLAALQATLHKIKEGAREQELKQAEAMVEQAKAGLENAGSSLERVRALHAQEAASSQTLEGVETQHKVAQAQYEAALQQLDLAREGARPEDIQAVEAQVRQAEAGMQLVETLNTTKSWEKDIAMAEAQLQQAEAGLKAAQIQVDSRIWEMQIALAKSQMDQAQVGLELAQQQLDDATVRAHVDGVISERTAEVGNMAAPGVSLFTLVDLSERRVVLKVSESDLGYLKLKQEAFVKVAGISESIPGVVQRISPTVQPDTRTGDVRIVLDIDDVNVRPGMYAEVRVKSHQEQSTLVVPRNAILGVSTGKPYVYVVEEGRSVRKDVELGLSQGEQSAIAKGLKLGEQVITSGQYSLSIDSLVHVIGQ